MRTIALATLAFAGTLVTGFDVASFLKTHQLAQEETAYKYTNAPIVYNETLGCESCIRGGYDFCIWRTFPEQTVHDQFTNCTNGHVTPEINSVSNVNETTRWVCSGNFKDEVNSIVNMCYPYASEKRNQALCGDYDVDLNVGALNMTRSIVDMQLNQSCTYRMHTNCGYPAIIYNSEQNITDEFDIAYITVDGLNSTQDIDTWNFNWTAAQFGNTPTFSAIGTNLTQTGPFLNTTVNETCTDISRNMWVTITRVAFNHENATEIAARQLASTNVSDISIYFFSTLGQEEPVPPVPTFGTYLMTSVGMLVCLISIFAF